MLGGAALLALSSAMPLAAAKPDPRQFTIAGPDGRAIAITEWRPCGRPAGLILFSHGAGSSPASYDLLLGPMVAAGWHILAPLHVDSHLHPATARYAGLASWKARLEDFRALGDHIGHKPYVAVGHSYGALTALVLGGAQSVAPPGWEGAQSDGNAVAAVAFSPPPAIPGLITAEGYGALRVPALIETGTLDSLPSKTGPVPDSWHAHLTAYDAVMPGHLTYGLVLEGVNHYFGGLICDFSQPGPPQTQGIRDASRVADLFLAAYGKADKAALSNLRACVSDQLPVRLMVK